MCTHKNTKTGSLPSQAVSSSTRRYIFFDSSISSKVSAVIQTITYIWLNGRPASRQVMFYIEGATQKSTAHLMGEPKYIFLYNNSARSKVANINAPSYSFAPMIMINTIVGYARSARNFYYTFFVDIGVIHEITTFIALKTEAHNKHTY